MSQFDLPRINFHGSATIDAATANNGKSVPLTIFDQENSLPFLPPRCYVAGITVPPGFEVKTDKVGNKYVDVAPINADNYQQWAVTPLGSFAADEGYLPLYNAFNNTTPITGCVPGYWNYFGDLSLTLDDVSVTGITVMDDNNEVVTYTPKDRGDCPAELQTMLNAQVSFNNNFLAPDSRTSAYMCDVDSEGQLCSQIFCGTVGLYDSVDNITFFTGTPVKSTARWMNLNKVLNWANFVPMGGSASFYAMVTLGPGSQLATTMAKYTDSAVNCLFMKLLIHQVYEVRMPDYAQLPVQNIPLGDGSTTQIPKNPAKIAITGSFTPWDTTDMQTSPLCRILKNPADSNITIDPTGIPIPTPKGTQPLGMPASIQFAPAFLNADLSRKLISLDLINTMNEYGTTYGTPPVYYGTGDVPPFTEFVNYNFGSFTLIFTNDNGTVTQIGDITYADDYNAERYQATGGMVDLVSPLTDYSQGTFSLLLNSDTVLTEDDVYITSDQQGIYADQGQIPANMFLSAGIPKEPCTLRVLYRGVPVNPANPISVTLQAINLTVSPPTVANTALAIYDGYICSFPVAESGCMTYAFVYDQSLLLNSNLSNMFNFVMQAYLVVLRVLASNSQLQPYLTGQQQINWQTVYYNIFVLYKTLYPVMDIVVPFTESNWSQSFIQQKLLLLTSLDSWNQPLYMPVTRDLTIDQRQLLTLWISAAKKADPNTDNI